MVWHLPNDAASARALTEESDRILAELTVLAETQPVPRRKPSVAQAMAFFSG